MHVKKREKKGRNSILPLEKKKKGKIPSILAPKTTGRGIPKIEGEK